MTCHRGPNGIRLAGKRHDTGHAPAETHTNAPTSGAEVQAGVIGHEACQPCPERHCRLCGHRHLKVSEQQTCARCIGAIRDRLTDVADLYAQLPGQARHGGSDGRLEAARPIPGGEAMAYLADRYQTGRGYVAQLRYRQRHNLDTSHVHDEKPNEAELAASMLWATEDDWRATFGHETAEGPATIGTALAYLNRHLHHAAQWHDGFAEWVDNLHAQASRLEAVLNAGERDDTAAAPCFDCGGQLVRRVTDRTDRATGGRSDRYACRRCHRDYDAASYWLAVRTQLEQAAEREAAG